MNETCFQIFISDERGEITMIITLKENATPEKVQELRQKLEAQGITLHPSQGDNYSLIGLIGDTSLVDKRQIESLDFVEKVTRIQEPFKKANRKFHPEDTIVDVSRRKNWGRPLRYYGRSLLCRNTGTSVGNGKSGQRSGRYYSSWRLRSNRVLRHTLSKVWALKACIYWNWPKRNGAAYRIGSHWIHPNCNTSIM